LTFLRAVSSDLATNNIEFDFTNQHVRCLAHIINLAAQQVLKTFNATASTSEDEFELLYNNNDNNREISPLHKVNIFFYLINNNNF